MMSVVRLHKDTVKEEMRLRTDTKQKTLIVPTLCVTLKLQELVFDRVLIPESNRTMTVQSQSRTTCL